MPPKESQANAINIAILKEKLDTLLVWFEKHDHKDDNGRAEMTLAIKEVMEVISELKDWCEKRFDRIEIMSAQEKLKLGSIVTILSIIGSMLLKFVFESITHIAR
jgi:hypothetical protein